MFSSIDHIDELLHVNSFPLQLQGRFQDNSPEEITASRNVEMNMNPKHNRRRKSSVSFMDTHDDQSWKDYKKRIAHREVERQRRQEMANLNLSLRSLLPYQFLEGKKSTSDYMDGAIEYIKDLNQRLDELNKRKKELQELLNLGRCFRNTTSKCSDGQESSSVKVNNGTSGMEVILNTNSKGGIPLSEFLNVLKGEGISIIRRCNSIKVNQRWLHIVEFEGIDVDPTKMLEKLQLLLVCNRH